jgi:hypothetical protein
LYFRQCLELFLTLNPDEFQLLTASCSRGQTLRMAPPRSTNVKTVCLWAVSRRSGIPFFFF